MELVDGQDLRTRIRHSPLPLAEIAVIGAGVSDALAYVHSLGIVHRDIKPANILLVPVRPGEPLRPKLTDFGIARMMDGTRLTATGTMVGTAAYLSPEQSRGADLGPASDIYSLGLVLLECIKGEVEYPGSAVESAVARLHRAPGIPDSVPAEWAQLIRAMTALDPLDRPSAADLEVALRHALVSPESLPGPLAEERTRVLPAPPARPPRLPSAGPASTPARATAPLDASIAATGNRPAAAGTAARAGHLLDPDAVTSPQANRGSLASRTASRFRLARRRTQILLSVALLALVTGAVAGRRRPRGTRATRRRPLSGRDRGPGPAPAGTAEERGTMNLTTRPPRAAAPRSSRALLTGWLLGTVLLAGTLAGCAPAPELDRDAARQLQSKVLAVTEAAAANDPAASLKHLDELVLKLDEAAARGEVSFKRHQSIRKSVDTVRADLNARQAEAEAARVAAEAGTRRHRRRGRPRRPLPRLKPTPRPRPQPQQRRLPRPPSRPRRRPARAREKARATARTAAGPPGVQKEGGARGLLPPSVGPDDRAPVRYVLAPVAGNVPARWKQQPARRPETPNGAPETRCAVRVESLPAGRRPAWNYPSVDSTSLNFAEGRMTAVALASSGW